MTWQAAEKVQKNEAGEYRALIDGAWVPAAKAQKNASGAYRVELTEQVTPRPETPAETFSPTDGMSRMDKFMAGADKFISNDLPTGIKQLSQQYMKASGVPIGVSEYALPPNISEAEIDKGIAETNAGVTADRERDKPLMDDPYGFAGNVTGGVTALLPTAAIPGANTYTGSALAGALYGLLQPTTEDESKLKNAAIGTGGGIVGKGLVQGAGKVLDPAKNATVEALRKAGVTLTPGQTMGGMWKTLEEKAMSIPVIGDFIRNAHTRGVESFNKTIANKVLAPIGATVDDAVKAGRQTFEQAHSKISQVYDDALKGVSVKADKSFLDDMTNIRQMVSELPDDLQKQFDSFLNREVRSRVGNGTIPGTTWKEVHSEAGRYANGIKRGKNALDDALADAYSEVRSSFQRLLERNSPDVAATTAKADEAYKMLKIMEDASSRAGSKSGVITPNQLAAAVRKQGSNSNVAKGKAVLQDFTESAQSTLADSVPNSGTTDRFLLNALALGGGSMLDLGATAAATGAGALTYSKPGNAVVNALLNQRPAASRAAGELVRKSGLPAALTGAGLATQ